jgi:hypothetical protein
MRCNGYVLAVVLIGFLALSASYAPPALAQGAGWFSTIDIDGDFSDWTEIPAHTDPVGDTHDTDHSLPGDTPSYVAHPDVDLVEYKISHDEENLYAYFRATGEIGRTQTAAEGKAGRYYVIVTIDVDDDDVTGYEICEGGYYPSSSGYDMNMEVEYYNGAFNTGHYLNHGCLDEDEYYWAMDEQAEGIVTVLPGTYDWYTQWVWWDTPQGNPGEVILPDGESTIMWVVDRGPIYQGIIEIALSPDKGEAEMKAPFRGFMKHPSGEAIMKLGNIIDVSFSLEASGELAPGGGWASDTAEPVKYSLAYPVINCVTDPDVPIRYNPDEPLVADTTPPRLTLDAPYNTTIPFQLGGTPVDVQFYASDAESSLTVLSADVNGGLCALSVAGLGTGTASASGAFIAPSVGPYTFTATTASDGGTALVEVPFSVNYQMKWISSTRSGRASRHGGKVSIAFSARDANDAFVRDESVQVVLSALLPAGKEVERIGTMIDPRFTVKINDTKEAYRVRFPLTRRARHYRADVYFNGFLQTSKLFSVR